MVKNFFRGLNKGTAFVLAALLGLGTVALAQTYSGYNPATGLNSTYGSDVSIGPQPTFVFSAGCGTVVSKAGGASGGTFTIGTFATSCQITITFPSAAPNGWYCSFNDLSTPADAPKQSVTGSTTTACKTTAATAVTGDVMNWTAFGY
jgi:hypothetical protein